ncbi:hypothetical protein MHB71_04890 [Paenibacillus sp. FSL H7-0940]|uniref:hypothetical protein n=1 Tax=Paenibacillus sp. FSL H7-0940 TaxID=2921443 RepID=UPI0030EC3FDB
MGRYRKKPVVVDAFCMGIDPRPDWFTDKVIANEILTYRVGGNDPTWPFEFSRTYCEIQTLEGVMRGDYGDYIIRGVAGEIYPCKPEIFEATYEEVRSPGEAKSAD